VVERRDLETLSRIAELSLPARYEVIVAPPGEPSTKPRALNIALACARGELIAVFDAEDAPAPDQLRLAASRFASEKTLDCLQARLSIRNREDSWLSRLFSIEYAALFDLINPGLCALELPIALGGTSNHFRVPSLTAVGGWDEWNVAEDADLGIRLARFGYRVASLDSETSEEAPHELANWFRQRVRWEKGWIQTLIVHSRQPIRFVQDLGAWRAVSAATLIAGSIVGALFWPAFAVGTIWRALSGRVGSPVGLARSRRRVHLHSRPVRRLVDRHPGRRRRAAERLGCEPQGARALAGLLSPGHGVGLDHHFRSHSPPALLGEDSPRPKAAAFAAQPFPEARGELSAAPKLAPGAVLL